MSKNLNLATMQEDASKYEETYSVTVFSDDGEEYKFEVDHLFSNSKISEVLTTYAVNLRKIQLAKVDVPHLHLMYLHILIICYFTSISEGIEDISQLEIQLEVMKHLINMGLLNSVFELLPVDQVSIVYEKMGDLAEETNLKVEEFKKANKPVFSNSEIESLIKGVL